MDRKSWFTTILVFIGAGFGAYGVFTNTGPVGGLNAFQQRIFGSYYALVSFAVMLAAFSIVGAIITDGLARLMGRKSDGVLDQVLLGPGAPTQAETPSAQGKTFFLSGLIIILLTWSICGGLYWKKVQNVQEDAVATYESIVLTDGKPIPHFTGKHLSLRGIPVSELQVVHKSSKSVGTGEDYRLLPVAGVGWKPGNSVNFIIKIDSSHPEPMPLKEVDWTPRNPREVRMLVRVAGTVPAPAIPEFKKMEVPLATDAKLIIPVASKDGKPVVADTGFDLFFLKISCIGITVIAVIMSLGLWLRRRYDLKKAGLL